LNKNLDLFTALCGRISRLGLQVGIFFCDLACMKYLIAFCFFAFGASVFGQSDTLIKAADTTEYVKKKPASLKAHNFGIVVESCYGILRMNANSYSMGGKTLSPETTNAFGARMGIFSVIKHWPLRVGAEFCFINTLVKYPNETVRSTESNIYSLTAEIPLLISHQFKSKDGLRGMHVSGGPRLIIPLKDFQSEYPQQRAANLSIDVALGIYRPWKLAKFEAELYYSLGLLNVLHPSNPDFRNTSINSLYRDCIGLRFFVR
jgi:hypothetical protein